MANRIPFQQKIYQECIDKFEECLRLENNKLVISGTSITKGELLENMINDYYFRLQGKTNDADTVNKISQFVDDATDNKFKNLEKKIDLINFNSVRMNKLLDIFMRVGLGSREENIKKKLGIWKDLPKPDSEEAAEKQYDEWLDYIFKEQSPIVEIIDSILYEEESEND